MFFIHSMGRYSKQNTANTLEELGSIVTKLLANQANDAVMVSIGKDDSAVMPYVWIRRNDDDMWEGELGDAIKLGIDDSLLIEKDPIQMLNLDQAIACGMVEVRGDIYDPRDDVGPVRPKTPPKPKNSQTKRRF